MAGALVGGVYPARRAVTAIRTRTVDINVLMVIAVAGALALGEWLEASSVVFLFALAQWLEARTLERARQAIRALVDLTPREAIVKRGGVEHRAPVETIAVGDLVIVRPGDKVPLDGRIVAGQSDVNEAPMTGESLPVDKGPGDEAYAGTINGRGALELEVTRIGPDTRLARIIHLVEAAQARRAPVQSFVDRFARIYTPAVIVLAALVAIVPPLVAGADVSTWLYRSLVLLVISCPCALVISTPGVDRVGAVRGGPQRRPDQRGRAPRAPRRRSRGRVRQDRNADPRRAGGDRGHRGGLRLVARRPAVCRGCRDSIRTSHRARDRCPCESHGNRGCRTPAHSCRSPGWEWKRSLAGVPSPSETWR